MREVILRTRFAPGDDVVLSGAVRELHGAHPGRFKTYLVTEYPDLWKNNRLVELIGSVEAKDGVPVIDCDHPAIASANRRPLHFVEAFAEDLGAKLGVAVPVRDGRGEVRVSNAERAEVAPVERLGRYGGNYWVLVAGGKSDMTVKWWAPERWQEVVDRLRGRVQFVQVGRAEDEHPELSGVIDLVGKTTLRELVLTVFHASGAVCPLTMVMHLAAAIECKDAPRGTYARPCVVVAGGREPARWNQYPTQQLLHSVGALECCRTGGCWKSRTRRLGDGDRLDLRANLCRDVAEYGGRELPRCMGMIGAGDVVRRIEMNL